MYYPDYEFYNGEGFLLLYQIEMQFICGINSPRQLPEMPLQEIQYSQEKEASLSRGGHRHLQIGRMLDIDLISEPPPPQAPSPQMYVSKVWESVWPEGAGSDS